MRSLAALVLLSAAPSAAQPVTVLMGETWVFAVHKGQPIQARKVAPSTKAGADQMKVSLQPMLGSTLTITNNSRFDYAYRATLVMPGGKMGRAKACAVPANGRMAVEHWRQPVAAVRLSDFRPAPAGSLCP
jgi:hypothetical protein